MEQQVNNKTNLENKPEGKPRRVTLQKQQARQSDKVIRRFICLVAVLLLVFVGYVVHNSRCGYYQYIKVENTEDSSDVVYEEFGDGYIKYSGSGIEYQKDFGESVWNESITLNHPIYSGSESYVLIGELGGNTIRIYNEAGKVSEIKLKYPVLQANISDQGICEVVIEATQTNMVQVYDKEGNLLVDAKASISENGYPLTAAISPDGTRLAISYYALEAMDTRSTVAVYDLSTEKQADKEALMKEFTYADEMIPKLYFGDNDALTACGDSSLHFYSLGTKVKEIKNINLKTQINSVFEWNGNLGIILDNSDNMNQGKCRIRIYNKEGGEEMDKVLDMNYETVQIRGKQLIAINKNECTIIDNKGRIRFQGELEGGGIAAMIPAGGFRTYHVIFNDRIVKMRLQFWEGNNDDL